MLVLTLTLCMPITAVAKDQNGLPFHDLADSYATHAILSLYNQKLLNGTGDGKFEPRRAITRAEMAALIARLFRLAPVNAEISPFADVSPDDWHHPWVQAVLQADIARGTEASRFEPSRPVTREETAVMLIRAANLSDQPTQRYSYADEARIAAYAKPAVQRMYTLGLMQGDGKSFRPKDPLTRQEAAIVMYETLNRPGWSEQISSEVDMRIQLGWQYQSSTEAYKQQILRSDINTLSPRWFFLNDDGLEITGINTELITWAHQRGKRVWAMVGNRSNQAWTHNMLSNADKRRFVIDQLTQAVKSYKLDGINVDFENVAPKDRKRFTQFIEQLAASLHPLGATLSVDLSPDMGTDWTEAYEYAELGRIADYIVLMGYDEHWGGSAMGSVSSIPWLRKGLSKLIDQVPADKVIFGLPFYTREWTIAEQGLKSDYLSIQQQNAIVRSHDLPLQWDDTLRQYTTMFRQNGQWHHIWLEEGRSLSEKIRLGEQMQVAGYAYWYMGGESADIWASLRNAMRISAYRFE